MNDAHLHLIVNHFPIIGTIFGLGILIAGFILENKTAISIAYVLFVISALTGFGAMFTGEGAEEILEELPEVGEAIIHEHEEMAEKFALVLYALGAISLVGMYMNVKQHAKAKLVSYIVLVVAAIAVFMGKEVGTSGGEIRHTEIRSNAGNQSTNVNQEIEHED